MTAGRLEQLLSRLARMSIAVVGDFFLDKYLELDPSLSEASLETGLEARQVVAVRCQPGAAGTIVANLCALGVGRVLCVGFTGDDGEGFELRRGLQRLGADTARVLVCADRFTPTYCKPLVREAGGLRELERLDTKNRVPLPADLEQALVATLDELACQVQAVIVQDQVQEPDCGVVTAQVRTALAGLAEAHPDVVWFGDSRARIGQYRNLITKPNRHELCQAMHLGSPEHKPDDCLPCAARLARRTGRPVYLTLGEEGMVLVTPDRAQQLPTARLPGPLDIVGAGDAATAGIVSALCAGASFEEAGVMGNLVASITVQQLGTTGTATPAQVREQFARYRSVWSHVPPALPIPSTTPGRTTWSAPA